MPVGLVTDEGGWLTIESQEFGITYEGQFRPDASEIAGAFKQGGFEAPVVFRHAAAGPH